MNSEQLVNKLQAYYGEYRPGQREPIVMYLDKKSSEELDKLYQALLADFSSKWGKPPDIAVFEETIQKNDIRPANYIRYAHDGTVYMGDREIGHIDNDRFIPLLVGMSADAEKAYLLNWPQYKSPQEFGSLLLNESPPTKKIDQRVQKLVEDMAKDKVLTKPHDRAG